MTQLSRLLTVVEMSQLPLPHLPQAGPGTEEPAFEPGRQVTSDRARALVGVLLRN